MTKTAEPQMAELVATVMEHFSALREAVVGYRVQLEAAGFSPTMAEVMASDFHRALINKMLA